MKKEERQLAKEAIEDFEYYDNRFHKTCGNDVEAKNIRKEGDKYIADVILHRRDENRTERFDECIYPLEIVNRIKHT